MRGYCFTRICHLLLRCSAWGLVVACSDQASKADDPAEPVQVRAEPQGFEPADPDTGVDWHSWNASVFHEARESQKPVLLYVARFGCDGLFSGDDPLARWQAQTRFVSVKIDPDRQPAIARRYAAAGCPSLSILRDTGEEIVRATDIRTENVPLLLRRIHEHLRKRPDVVDKELQEAHRVSGQVDGHKLSVEAVEAAVVSAYDTQYGGFGGPQKFPETQVLALLQELAQSRNNPRSGAMVERTLDALLASPLWANTEMNRSVLAQSHTPDWRTPRYEAHAADQAGLLIVLGRAANHSANYRQAGQQLFDVIRTEWFDENAGAFRARRIGESGVDSVWADTLMLADANALLIRACLQAGTALGRQQVATDMAERAAATLQARFITAAGAVRHTPEAGASVGLLRDQMLVALALEEVSAQTQIQTKREAFVASAQRVRRWAEEHLWDDERGTYLDAVPIAWLHTWTDMSDDSDDRAPSGQAVAAEAALAAGDTTRAARILGRASLSAPADRRHAAMARQLLRLTP